LFDLRKRTSLGRSKLLLVFGIVSELIRLILFNCSPTSGTFVCKADQLDAFLKVRLGLLELLLNRQEVSLGQIRDSLIKAVKELRIKLKLDSVTFKLK